MLFSPAKILRQPRVIQGFTLIEMSIVLVIIGLIVGGILVGQDLISAASARAQIAQIEKYQTAVNTFRGKYGYLPGDMPNPDASNFGFVARPTSCFLSGCAGQGNGDGVIEGTFNGINLSCCYRGDLNGGGETIAFWNDLSTAGLIAGSFSGNEVGTFNVSTTSSPTLDTILPAAKIGQGNYVYVWSGGTTGLANVLGATPTTNPPNGVNYFGISAVNSINCCAVISLPGLSVSQAFNIDKKIDDGLPQTGKVIAAYIANNNGPNGSGVWWAAGGNNINMGFPQHFGTADTSATSYATINCYDNNGVVGTQTYSLAKNASAINCAVSFQFQ